MLLSNNKEVTANQNTAKLESHAPHISQVCSGDLEKISVFHWRLTNLCQGGKLGRASLRLSRLFTSHSDLYALCFQVHLQDRVRHSKYFVFMVQVHPCPPKTLPYLIKLSVKVRRKLFLGEVKIYSQLWECIKAPGCVRSGLHWCAHRWCHPVFKFRQCSLPPPPSLKGKWVDSWLHHCWALRLLCTISFCEWRSIVLDNGASAVYK